MYARIPREGKRRGGGGGGIKRGKYRVIPFTVSSYDFIYKRALGRIIDCDVTYIHPGTIHHV